MAVAMIAYAVIALVVYILSVCIYRACLSPLAKFPGPKLAAITRGYEMYYDLVLKARFPWHLKELHEKYGPIVRIAPDELHISDIGFADTLFSSTLNMDKYKPHQHQFGMPESSFNTIDSGTHKMRRGALAPFFSRRSINALESVIVEKVDKMCERLQEFRENKAAVDLRLLFSCLTTDMITEYAFPNCFNLLDTPDLSPAWRNTFAEGLRNFQWFKHFPSLWSVMRSIPDDMLLKMWPQMAITLNWERNNQKLVREIVDTFQPHKTADKMHPTIFHELLGSDLPEHEKSYERLWQEGSALIGAGVETTSNMLNVALFHLIQNPDKLAPLKQELNEAMPDPSQLAPWAKLETLPYLTVVIRETLRMGYASSSRFIRVAPKSNLRYREHVIPAGAAVSMTVMHICQNPDLFEDPFAFKPERWMTTNKPTDLYVFGRGPRMCVGQNLAYAELYLTLAAIIRRFDLALYETDFSDIEGVCDALLPMPKRDTKGVRVMVS